MVELKNNYQMELFSRMIDDWYHRKDGLKEIWDCINSVKTVPIIPGLNILTIYQLADYFETSYQSIKRIYQLKISGNKNPLTNIHLGANVLKDFSNSWETIQSSDGRRIKIEYPKFSIIVPPSEIICFPAIEIITFITNLKESELNSKIIEALIRKSPRNGKETYPQTFGDKLFKLLINENQINSDISDGEAEFINIAREAYRAAFPENKREDKTTVFKITINN